MAYGIEVWNASGVKTFDSTARYMRLLLSDIITGTYTYNIPTALQSGVSFAYWCTPYEPDPNWDSDRSVWTLQLDRWHIPSKTSTTIVFTANNAFAKSKAHIIAYT